MSNLPLEEITEDSMTMRGITREHYQVVAPYLKRISNRVEVSSGNIVYNIDEEYGGGVIESSARDGTLKITSEVTAEVIDSIRDAFKSAESKPI